MSGGDPLFDWLVASGVLPANPAHTVRESYDTEATADDYPTPLTAREADATPTSSIGEQYWSVRSTPADNEAAETLTLRGAVLVNVKGARHDRVESRGANDLPAAPTLSPELAAALNEPTTRPLHALWDALTKDGILGPAVAMLALSLAVVGVVFEAVLLRSALDMGTASCPGTAAVGRGHSGRLLAAILLGLEFVLASAERRMGAPRDGCARCFSTRFHAWRMRIFKAAQSRTCSNAVTHCTRFGRCRDSAFGFRESVWSSSLRRWPSPG
jgi:hypothetical protein